MHDSMNHTCTTCGQIVYWNRQEGFCHIGQTHRARYRCRVCGYEGDCTDQEYQPHSLWQCPRCSSDSIMFDHQAALSSEVFSKLMWVCDQCGMGFSLKGDALPFWCPYCQSFRYRPVWQTEA
jgi:rubrerythrin